MTMILNMRPSRIALVLGLGLCLGLGLASCEDNGNDARTVSGLARQLVAENTTETDEPIVINDVPLTGRDTNETKLPAPI